jgi:hypothetical protein
MYEVRPFSDQLLVQLGGPDQFKDVFQAEGGHICQSNRPLSYVFIANAITADEANTYFTEALRIPEETQFIYHQVILPKAMRRNFEFSSRLPSKNILLAFQNCLACRTELVLPDFVNWQRASKKFISQFNEWQRLNEQS